MPSPSTLARQARNTKNKAKAAALRKKAAAIRRKQRRKQAVRAFGRLARASEPQLARLARARQENMAEQARALPAGALVATHNEGGWTAGQYQEPRPLVSTETIERLRKLAHDKKDPENFAINLRTMYVDGKASGRKESDERNTQTLKAIREAADIQVVCGFMAIVKHAEKINGALPPVVAIAGHTVAKIYDALRDAGYTENGKDAGFRARR